MIKNMSQLIKIVLSLLIVFHSGISLAQDTTVIKQPAIWNLQTCLAYAKQNNIQIISLKLGTKTTEQALLLSKAAQLPDLYGSASQSLNHGQGSSVTSSGSIGINSALIVYNGGYLKTDIKQKSLSVKSADLSVEEQENTLVIQITQAYLNILLDKESIIYSNDLVKTSKAQLIQAQQRFSAGSIARRDVVQFEAQLASDTYTLTTAENAQRQDVLSLKQLLQISHETAFEVASPDTIKSRVLIPALNEVRKFALENRPEIKNSEYGVQIARLDLDKAKSGYLPTLSLSGSTGTNYASNSSYSYTGAQFNNNFNQQIGLTLSVPIFTKRANKTNTELAKIAIDQAELSLKNTKLLLSQDIEQYYISALNAQGQFNAAEKQYEYNEEIYRIATEELRLGAANVFDFYQQRNLFVQAQQAYVQAKYNAALSASTYNFYLGIPVNL
ncbi:RND efflux system, outer membrane lipoprotein CmeC [Arcticibacter svalbardensis MN12-7]|uniref:RND efflux system, outer membrane lipoprotein CmeC n=2 Tax=Arcticibacter TaxID=1288026 RepID=R9GVU2_9SPHI|nr:RND efflux system, outer membrane lipoprotein CmeC [Arcticibacter svalbardensis MN12-7]